jgi:hypothetical protein
MKNVKEIGHKENAGIKIISKINFAILKQTKYH